MADEHEGMEPGQLGDAGRPEEFRAEGGEGREGSEQGMGPGEGEERARPEEAEADVAELRVEEVSGEAEEPVEEAMVEEGEGEERRLPSAEDSPLVDPREAVEEGRDGLGLAPLAWRLAWTILAEPSEKSVVYAIYGGWGTGKSTALNFLEWFLNDAAGPRAEGKEGEPWAPPGIPANEGEKMRRVRPVEEVAVVRFDPWWYEKRGDIVAALFAEIEEQCGQAAKERGEERPNFLDKLKTFAARVPWRAPGLTALRDVLLASLGPGGLSLAWGAGVAAKMAEDLDSEHGEREKDAETEVTTSALHTWKRELCEALEEWGRIDDERRRRIVVLVDDLDRLSHEEVADTMRAIRAVGDLPFVSYVIAVDREAVVKALKTQFGGDEDIADQYLDKIVQMPVELPEPPVAWRRQWLRARLGELAMVKGAREGDLGRAAALAAEALTRPRLMKRLIQRLSGLLAKEGMTELPLGAVAALEAIAEAYPKVWDGIIGFMDKLLEEADPGWLESPRERFRAELKGIKGDLQRVFEEGKVGAGVKREFFQAVWRAWPLRELAWPPEWRAYRERTGRYLMPRELRELLQSGEAERAGRVLAEWLMAGRELVDGRMETLGAYAYRLDGREAWEAAKAVKCAAERLYQTNEALEWWVADRLAGAAEVLVDRRGAIEAGAERGELLQYVDLAALSGEPMWVTRELLDQGVAEEQVARACWPSLALGGLWRGLEHGLRWRRYVVERALPHEIPVWMVGQGWDKEAAREFLRRIGRGWMRPWRPDPDLFRRVARKVLGEALGEQALEMSGEQLAQLLRQELGLEGEALRRAAWVLEGVVMRRRREQ